MNQMKKIFLIVLILLWVVLPVSGAIETATAYDNISDPGISPTPIWSDIIGTEKVLVSCSNDGEYVIAGSNSGIFRMYDRMGQPLWTYKDSNNTVTSVSITDTGEYAAATFYGPYPNNGGILTFNRNGTSKWKYPQVSEQRNNFAMSGNGSIAVISVEKELNQINKSGLLIANTTMPEEICRIAVSDDGSISAVASNSRCSWRGASGTISGVDPNGRILFIYPVELSFIDIGISRNGERIVGVDENQLYAFDRSGKLLWNYSNYPQFRSVAVSLDGQYVSAGSQYYVWYFNRTGALLWNHYQNKGSVNAVSVSGDGSIIVAASSNKILTFDKTGTLLWQYTTLSDVTSVSISKDGNYLAAGTKNMVYFFNHWGNTTIIERQPFENIFITSQGSTVTQSKTIPSTQPAPLMDSIAFFATGVCVLIRMEFLTRR